MRDPTLRMSSCNRSCVEDEAGTRREGGRGWCEEGKEERRWVPQRARSKPSTDQSSRVLTSSALRSSSSSSHCTPPRPIASTHAPQLAGMLLWCGVRSLRASRERVTLRRSSLHRYMATVRSSLPHEDRTAAEPRENRLEPVVLSHIRQINESIRTLRLRAIDPNHSIKVGRISQNSNPLFLTDPLPVKFAPGQWLDTFIPGLDKAGGFTITSTPSEARPSSHSPAYLELAVSRAASACLSERNSDDL